MEPELLQPEHSGDMNVETQNIQNCNTFYGNVGCIQLSMSKFCFCENTIFDFFPHVVSFGQKREETEGLLLEV